MTDPTMNSELVSQTTMHRFRSGLVLAQEAVAALSNVPDLNADPALALTGEANRCAAEGQYAEAAAYMLTLAAQQEGEVLPAASFNQATLPVAEALADQDHAQDIARLRTLKAEFEPAKQFSQEIGDAMAGIDKNAIRRARVSEAFRLLEANDLVGVWALVFDQIKADTKSSLNSPETPQFSEVVERLTMTIYHSTAGSEDIRLRMLSYSAGYHLDQNDATRWRRQVRFAGTKNPENTWRKVTADQLQDDISKDKAKYLPETDSAIRAVVF